MVLAFKSKFAFVGEPSVAKKDPTKFVNLWKGGKDKNMDLAKLQFFVNDGKNASAMVESFGSVYKIIKTRTKDGENIDVHWENRRNLEIIEKIAEFRKFVVDLGEPDGRQEFITEYDMICYLKDALPSYQGKVRAIGEFRKELYNGTLYDHFNLERVYAVSDDTPNSFDMEMDLFYNSDCVDKTELDEGRVYVNGYIKQYIRGEGEKFLPQAVVMDFNKLAEKSEKADAKMLSKVLLPKIDIKASTLYDCPWRLNFVNGAETEDFDEDMLTDEQMEMINLGLATVDDYKRGVRGANVREFRMRTPMNNIEAYKHGPVDSGYSMAEIEENLYVMPSDESSDKLEAAVEKESSDDGIDMDDILGEL